jgi:hypothetical protein
VSKPLPQSKIARWINDYSFSFSGGLSGRSSKSEASLLFVFLCALSELRGEQKKDPESISKFHHSNRMTYRLSTGWSKATNWVLYDAAAT